MQEKMFIVYKYWNGITISILQVRKLGHLKAIGRGGVGGHIASKCQTGISTQLSNSTAKRSSTASIFPCLNQTSENKGFPIDKSE